MPQIRTASAEWRYLPGAPGDQMQSLVLGAGDLFIWLVVSNIFYFPFHIWDVILPIDFHIFHRGCSTTNQYIYNLSLELFHICPWVSQFLDARKWCPWTPLPWSRPEVKRDLLKYDAGGGMKKLEGSKFRKLFITVFFRKQFQNECLWKLGHYGFKVIILVDSMAPENFKYTCQILPGIKYISIDHPFPLLVTPP